MTSTATSDLIDFDAAWLREQRQRLGWSTTTMAERARDKAREFGDSIKLPQQLVSKFENGRLKSVPRWIVYAQLAIADELRDRDLPPGRLWKLRIPPELEAFFADRISASASDEIADDVVPTLVTDVTYVGELMERMSPYDRQLMVQLAERLAGSSADEVHRRQHTSTGDD